METWNALAVPRREMNSSTWLERLASLPWYVNILLGEAIFVACKWVLPAVFVSDPQLFPVADKLSGLAWLLSSVFFLLGGIGFTSWKKQRS